MPVYPLEGSIALIDGVVVAMFDFFGRIDVIEDPCGTFIANFSHTGKSTSLDFQYDWYLYKDGLRMSKIVENTDIVSKFLYEPGQYYFKVYLSLPNAHKFIYTNSQTFEVK
jgi:hypothetical protein